MTPLSALFSRFKRPCPTDDELRAFGMRPTIRLYEAAALIQGLLPQRKVGRGDIAYLDDYETEVRRLIHAAAQGHLTDPCSPHALIEWCTANDVALPETFVSSAAPQTNGGAPQIPECRRTDERVHVLHDTVGRPRHRKDLTVGGYDHEVMTVARRLFIAYVEEHGTQPPKKLLINKVSAQMGRPRARLERAFAISRLATKRELQVAKRHYRRRWHQQMEDYETV